MKHILLNLLTVLLLLPFTELYNPCSKTRWSSLHNVPDADLLDGGKFVIDAHGQIYSIYNEGYTCKPTAIVNIGVAEWINLEAGYAGGGTFGLKARILGETGKVLPSMAVGVHNVFSHKEAYNNGFTADSLNSEIYVAFAKSIENLKIRVHLGIQSIPQNDKEKLNPFFAVEKYFGKGLYMSIEMQKRDERFLASLISSFRPFKKRKLEAAIGLVDFGGLFDKKNDKTSVKFSRSEIGSFTRPSIFIGLRFLGAMKLGKSDGFTGLEDRIARQNQSLTMLKDEVDSLKNMLNKSKTKLDNIDQSLKEISDSSENSYNQLKLRVSQKLLSIKSLYEAEPFEPENVKKAMHEIVSQRDAIVPVLSEIALDKKENSQIRTYAVSVMGAIGSRSASDAMIEILAQTNLSEMKIEALIGLGNLKEVKARYLIQQLANDLHDGVAFTATEVLKKLERETGIKLTKESAGIISEKKIPEKKIGINQNSQIAIPVTIDTSSTPVDDSTDNLNTVNEPAIVESSIDQESIDKIDSLPAPTLVIDTLPILSKDTVLVTPVIPATPKILEQEKPKKKRKRKEEKGEW